MMSPGRGGGYTGSSIPRLGSACAVGAVWYICSASAQQISTRETKEEKTTQEEDTDWQAETRPSSPPYVSMSCLLHRCALACRGNFIPRLPSLDVFGKHGHQDLVLTGISYRAITWTSETMDATERRRQQATAKHHRIRTQQTYKQENPKRL